MSSSLPRQQLTDRIDNASPLAVQGGGQPWPRPTPPGWCLAGGGIFLAGAGLYQGHNAVLLAGCFLLAVFLAAGCFARWNLSGVAIARAIPWPLYAGSYFQTRLTVRNRKRFLPLREVVLQQEVQGGGLPRGLLLSGIGHLPPGSEVALRQRGRFFRRGEKTFGEVVLRSAFPLGLARCSVRVPVSAQKVVVYPRVRTLTERFLPSAQAHLRTDWVPVAAQLGEREYAGVREYRPGDNPKWIHWRASARLADRWLVKEFDATGVSRVGLRFLAQVPDPAAIPRGGFERAVTLAASMACLLIRAGYEVEARIDGTSIGAVEIQPGGESLRAFLRHLAVLTPSQGTATQAGQSTYASRPSGATLWIDPMAFRPGRPWRELVRWSR